MPTLRRSTLALLAALFAGPLAAPRAVAATVTASVTDKAGRALPGAVVMLEPVSGKLPVKPMSGIEIAQSKRKFVPDVTVVTLCTAVTFPNLDTVRHHVYSFSGAKSFELKLYAGVPAAPVVFDKAGIAILGCNIHDAMAAWVVVADTPWAARSVDAGRARIESIPPGQYKLRLWHAGLAPGAEPAVALLTIGAADAEHSARLAVRAEP